MGTNAADGSDKARELVYKAESRWRNTNDKAGQSISLQGAHDLVGEMLFHPANDDIPGIEVARRQYGKGSIRPHNDVTASVQYPHLPESTLAYTHMHPEGTVIRFKPEKLTVGTAAHEGIHLIESHGRLQEALERMKQGSEFQVPGTHNGSFTGNMIRNVHASIAKDAAHALRAHYDAIGVPYRTWEG